jgi:hypothetical protein
VCGGVIWQKIQQRYSRQSSFRNNMFCDLRFGPKHFSRNLSLRYISVRNKLSVLDTIDNHISTLVLGMTQSLVQIVHGFPAHCKEKSGYLAALLSGCLTALRPA